MAALPYCCESHFETPLNQHSGCGQVKSLRREPGEPGGPAVFGHDAKFLWSRRFGLAPRRRYGYIAKVSASAMRVCPLYLRSLNMHVCCRTQCMDLNLCMAQHHITFLLMQDLSGRIRSSFLSWGRYSVICPVHQWGLCDSSMSNHIS
jgi:hypothetical protein